MSSNTGAFAYQEHLAGDCFGIAQTGITAQLDEPLADSGLVLSDNLTCGMVLIRQFDRGIRKCTPPTGFADEPLANMLQPGRQLTLRVARMRRVIRM